VTGPIAGWRQGGASQPKVKGRAACAAFLLPIVHIQTVKLIESIKTRVNIYRITHRLTPNMIETIVCIDQVIGSVDVE